MALIFAQFQIFGNITNFFFKYECVGINAHIIDSLVNSAKGPKKQMDRTGEVDPGKQS